MGHHDVAASAHHPDLALPDGLEVGEDEHGKVSRSLGRPIEIRSAGTHGLDVGGTYEAPLDVERDADWLSWQGPGGAFHDSARARVSVVSVPTLRHWDRRRFRTNVIVDATGEDDLVG